MKRQVLDVLCCPKCKHDLTLIETQIVGEEIIEGFLNCNNCQILFEISKGVPRMIIDTDNRKEIAESWDFEWAKVAEGMFEEGGNVYGITEEEELNRFFRYLAVAPGDLRGKFILDAGCGRGRLIKPLAKHGAVVFGMDVSSTLVDVYEDCKRYENANIIQADILNLPFRIDMFNYVWAMGSIFLTGNTKRAFENLSNLVKSSGKLFVSVRRTGDTNFGIRVRDFLAIYFHRIPKNILFYLSYILAFLLSLVKKILRKQRAPLKTTAFFLFDHLAHLREIHTEGEVINWFKEGNFYDITFINEKPRVLIFARGTKR
jgi:uncharacterized protein YbaR (Trm112 family)/ubiquinone/menaquinone biosynthesis C-methylase UbiE